LGYEVEGVRCRGRPKKTWSEVIKKECQTKQLYKEDAMNRRKWRKLLKILHDSDKVRVGVNIALVPGHPV